MASFGEMLASEDHKYMAAAARDAEKSLSDVISIMHKAGMMSYEDHESMKSGLGLIYLGVLGGLSRDLDKRRGK
jgi:hypothetical protein